MATEAEILERLKTDTPYYAEKLLKVNDEDGELVPLVPRPAQLKVEAAIRQQRKARVPVRIIVVKSRKTGVSTYCEGGMVQRTTTIPNRRGLIVAHDTDTAGELFEIASLMYAHLPDDPILKPAIVSQRSSQGGMKLLHFGEPSRVARQRGELGVNSTIKIDTAREVQAGRGKTIHDLHCCLTPETPILLDDGRSVPVREANVGARIVTHNGQTARISAILAGKPGAPNGNGRTIRITPWLGGVIELTPNHPVWTERGWVEAGDLTMADRVSMPVREIEHSVLALRLPDTPNRRQGGGRQSIGAGELLELDEEVGFAFGYYIAEGSVLRGKTYPSGITFSRHRAEGAYAERAIAALSSVTSRGRTIDRANTLTSQDTVYGAPLARLVQAEFGEGAEKRVPDWVFKAGQPFLRGLLAGYLCGDGSKTNDRQGDYTLAKVVATTICSSIATQMRDIAAALGYGWANIRQKEGGDLYGRNCRPAWTVQWTGRAARSLRALIGLEVPEGGRERSEKAEIRDGKVWLKIRRLEEGETDLVYDVEVDHPDHSFRTLHFAVKNTEVAHWPDPRKALSLLNAVPDRPGTVVVLESTANGHNFFKQRWDRAMRGEGGFIPVFIGWTEDPNCSTRFPDPDTRERFIESIGTGPWGEDEPRLIEQYDVTPEQLYWRRQTIVDKTEGKLELFDQEYPSDAARAFVGSGKHVFSLVFIQRAIDRAEQIEQLPPEEGGPKQAILKETGTRKRKIAHGEIEIPTGAIWVPRQATGFDHSHDFWTYWFPPVTAESEAGKEDPKPPGQYIVSIDPAGGEENTSGEGAYHGVQVIDHRSGEQVAELETRRLDPDQLAREALMAALLYNDALITVERTGGYGTPILRWLWDVAGWRRMYRQRSLEAARAPAAQRDRVHDSLGWDTNRTTKPQMEAGMTELLREGTHGIRSLKLALQLTTYVVKPNGKHEPDDEAFADLLTSYMQGKEVARETRLRPDKPASGPISTWARPLRDPKVGW